MRRQRRQRFFIQLMLLAMLLAPLQGFAAVYANMDPAHSSMAGDVKTCQYDERAKAKKAGDHCMHDMQCNTHCDHCAHCQYFPTAPFALNRTRQNHIDRGIDIAFVSHIPLVAFRPPRLA